MNQDEYRRTIADVMMEDALQVQIEQLARALGWLVYHTHNSRRSAAGFPDLCMVKGGRLIFAELKRQAPKHKPTADQERWLTALVNISSAIHNGQPIYDSGSVEVFLWRPLDFLDGTVERALAP